MGLKISVVLGFLLMLSLVGFKMQHDKAQAQIENLNTQLRVAAANQETLQAEVAGQNQQILDQQARVSSMMNQVNDLQEANQEALRESADLRAKFARHDLNRLSLRKPKLMENIINRGTQEVFDELTVLTSRD